MSLGRGIESLIPTKSVKKADSELEQTGERVYDISVEQIDPNPNQPRRNFARMEMEKLIDSIQMNGIIQPLILVKKGEKRYEIVAGERRWRSAKILGLKTVPCLVRAIDVNKKLEIALLENIQRKNLNAMEKARAYQRLIDEFNLTQKDISKRLGMARATIANTLRLLKLPKAVQNVVEQEKISEGHAKALCSISDATKQEMLLKRILGLGLTVRETAKMINAKQVKRKAKVMPELEEKAEILSKALDARVKINQFAGKIKILIDVYNQEDLDIIIEKVVNR